MSGPGETTTTPGGVAASSAAASAPAPRRPRGAAGLEARLRRELRGEVLFDPFSRGRYSTDASMYQVEPLGVVVPRTEEDVVAALQIAAEHGVSLTARGGATSQCGQTVGEGLIVDWSKYLNELVSVDVEARRAVVQPGLVLDQMNAKLKASGLFFPVDVSTSAMATLGGMAGNNSCGTRSLRYGNMVHNTVAIDAILADGSRARFDDAGVHGAPRLAEALTGIHAREAEEIERRFPKIQRRVSGYNLDQLARATPNFSRVLVGSEGTLALFRRIELTVHPIPRHKVLGICHFPSFRRSMETAEAIVGLKPAAVELVDRTMLELGRGIPIYRVILDRFIRGEPQALLFVEFAGEDLEVEKANLKRFVELMADLGLPDSVVEVLDPAEQAQVWTVRKAGLNIMMSMKGDAKPVSFIEDCAVPLPHLAEYTERLTAVFEKHGTTGTWYAHASEGCLHVRPVLNLKQEVDVRKMRAIAEEAFAYVRAYKGSHSGEHGDGLVRTEFNPLMFGERLMDAFREVKRTFDPKGVLNPGKIVDGTKMDDRSLFRFKPGYGPAPIQTALDWSEWGGFLAAAEMCNNNGQCRQRDASVMCPSYRATMDEEHVTRGRANSLRLALSGQLGEGALTSPDMLDALSLCVSCKACKRECPTGVDMSRMKIEVLYQHQKRHGLTLRDRLVSWLPRYASVVWLFGWLLNLRNKLPFLAVIGEWLTGFSRHRKLPTWSRQPFRDADFPVANPVGEVALLADTFGRWFEPGLLRSAVEVLQAAGYSVHALRPEDGGRPLCCGRTFFASGRVEEAREELRRLVGAALPFARRGVPILGLEPSCLLTLRDEASAVLPGEATRAVAAKALLFEEFLALEKKAGRLRLALGPVPWKRALVHGHCHQKAFNVLAPSEAALRLVPGLEVAHVTSSCCGMAGSFGYHAEHYDVSMKMAEASLLPAVRKADADTIVVADGTSCRHQIRDGAAKEGVHVAQVLHAAMRSAAAGAAAPGGRA